MRSFARGVRVACILIGITAILGGGAPAAWADTPPDFSAPGEAFNVLPPGQDGGFVVTPSSRDQIPLYDGLTPKFDDVTAGDLPTFFKPNVFGLAGATPKRVETVPGHPGLRIERDGFNVPHVFGETRDDVVFGAGFVTSEDRFLLMDLLRGPGRLAALDAPGIDPFQVATQLQQFTPSQQTEDFLASQVRLFENRGEVGQRILADVDSYLEGVNNYRTRFGVSGAPWTRNDVVAVAALVGAIFGKGGGDEARRSQFLSALSQRLGERTGRQVFNDLAEQNDPEAPVSLPGRFKLNGPSPHDKGNAVIDAASLDTSAARAAAVAQTSRKVASNGLLIGAGRSETGRPLMVAGPQVGYFYPQVLFEMDLHGGGIDARGASFPGAGPYVQLGRGADFSWSATSAGTDIIDQYVETLCGGSDRKYLYRGSCRDMTRTDGGVLGPGIAAPPGPVSFYETVHGPVIGYATVHGKRVAISFKRSTRGREVASAYGFEALNANRVHSAQSFFAATSQIDYTFNWLYEDQHDIAMFSSGLVPSRNNQVDQALPTIGTGKYEWRGFLSPGRHPHAVNPPSGEIVNWNNKPARDWDAADSQWGYGSVHRVNLLQDAVARRDKHSLASLVGAMNRAATQDLRITRVLPSIAAVLETGPAPTPREQQMLSLLEQWRAQGASRLDRDLDGAIDAPGAAIMDAAWPRIADAVMRPVLGPQLNDLAGLITRDDRPAPKGSAYQDGWYGYVDKDLRRLTGKPVAGPFRTHFCGAGDLVACRASLWQALAQAGDELAGLQGSSDPAGWRADATGERIRFLPGFLPATMRWTNRPTFQQAISFSGHR